MDTFLNTAGMDVAGFGARIKQVRIARGLSQRALGKLMGVTNVCILKWEKGDNFPKSDGLVKLASVLGTSVSYLCSGTNMPRGDQAAADGVQREHLRQITLMARQMIAEAASVPLESVNIYIDQPELASDGIGQHRARDSL